MPIVLDPDTTFEVVLQTDADKPQPPRFVFHYLTTREWIKAARLAESLQDSKDGAEAIEKIADVVSAAFVRVENAGDTGELLDILTPGELIELLESVVARIKPTAEDLGK